MGTISATNAAVRLGNKIDGMVLTSSVSAPIRRLHDASSGVLDLDLKAIAVPALVMASTHDACLASPPGNADVIARRMTQSPRKAVKFIEGGSEPKSEACQPFAYHGYYGVEDKAVAAIVDFVTAK
jgi:alpha-beta hydrolase superfamily lysophospholipase